MKTNIICSNYISGLRNQGKIDSKILSENLTEDQRENSSDRIKGYKKAFTPYKNAKIERFSVVGSCTMGGKSIIFDTLTSYIIEDISINCTKDRRITEERID